MSVPRQNNYFPVWLSNQLIYAGLEPVLVKLIILHFYIRGNLSVTQNGEALAYIIFNLSFLHTGFRTNIVN